MLTPADLCALTPQAIYRMRTDRYQDVQRSSADAVTESIFKTMDVNKDGKISLDEFIEGAKVNATLVNLLSTS